MFERHEISFSTENSEMKNITDDVEEIVSESDMDEGFCLVFSKHTTAGIVVNEDEYGLRNDVLENFEKIFPEGKKYQHNRGHDENATSHLKTVLTGPSEVIPFEESSISLGTWQQVFLVETDGPRRREVRVYLIG